MALMEINLWSWAEKKFKLYLYKQMEILIFPSSKNFVLPLYWKKNNAVFSSAFITSDYYYILCYTFLGNSNCLFISHFSKSWALWNILLLQTTSFPLLWWRQRGLRMQREKCAILKSCWGYIAWSAFLWSVQDVLSSQKCHSVCRLCFGTLPQTH